MQVFCPKCGRPREQAETEEVGLCADCWAQTLHKWQLRVHIADGLSALLFGLGATIGIVLLVYGSNRLVPLIVLCAALALTAAFRLFAGRRTLPPGDQANLSGPHQPDRHEPKPHPR